MNEWEKNLLRARKHPVCPECGQAAAVADPYGNGLTPVGNASPMEAIPKTVRLGCACGWRFSRLVSGGDIGTRASDGDTKSYNYYTQAVITDEGTPPEFVGLPMDRVGDLIGKTPDPADWGWNWRKGGEPPTEYKAARAAWESRLSRLVEEMAKAT